MKQARHKRTNIEWFHLYKVPKIGKFIEKDSIGYQGLEGMRRMKSYCLTHTVSVWNVLEMVMVIAAQQCEHTECYEIVHLKKLLKW